MTSRLLGVVRHWKGIGVAVTLLIGSRCPSAEDGCASALTLLLMLCFGDLFKDS
jgi:hypothetical protein